MTTTCPWCSRPVATEEDADLGNVMPPDWIETLCWSAPSGYPCDMMPRREALATEVLRLRAELAYVRAYNAQQRHGQGREELREAEAALVEAGVDPAGVAR